MSALSWQAAIAISIFAVFLFGAIFLRLKRAIQLGLGMVLFWGAWTLGLSTLFIGYSVEGELQEFQLLVVLFIGGLALAALISYKKWEKRQSRIISENASLRSEMSELKENLGAPEPPRSSSPSRFLIGTKAHRKALIKLLNQAQSRLIVLSGWVTPYGLSPPVKKALEAAAKRGVRIYVGWGYRTKLERESTKQKNPAEQALLELERKYPSNFDAVYFENHAKLLLVDITYVVGSFNWLSNAFSENEELSVVIEDPPYVDEMYRSIVSNLEERKSDAGVNGG